MFTLHERLKNDTAEIVSLKLCIVLLMKDRSFPWLILVPKRECVREIHELSPEDRITLMEEMTLASRAIEKVYRPEKINIGALGNLVPQLHIHVIGRFSADRAWPGPVWGSGQAVPYGSDELKSAVSALKEVFNQSAGTGL